MAEWSKVNICEEGGNWSVAGASYSGGLGWLHATWSMFRTADDPSDMADATPAQQVAAAVQFAIHYYGNPYWAPDQSGCGGGY